MKNEIVFSVFLILAASLEGLAAPTPAGENVQFQTGGHVLGFSPEGVVVASRTHALKIDFLGAQRILPSADEAGSSGAARPMTRVRYPGLWTGITLEYAATSAGLIKSAYEVMPGADPGTIALKTNVPARIDSGGFLHYRFQTGEMIESRPVAWQEKDGKRISVDAEFVIRGESEVGFRVGDYDPETALMIDPVLTWNTFLGRAESATDQVRGIAVDGSNGIYICGQSDGPWGSPVRAFGGGPTDAFVAKFSSTGARQWVTFLGGTAADDGCGVAADAAGHVYVVGTSSATWQPGGKSPKRAYTKLKDAFVAQLNAMTGVLAWNAFLGGNGDDLGAGVAFGTESGGSYVYAVGTSSSAWGTPVRGYAAGTDAFAARISDGGVFQWNTFLGGSGNDSGNGIAFSSNSQAAFIVGESNASWGEVIGRSYTASTDGFVAKMIGSTAALQWNAFLGGSQSDTAEGVVVDGTYGNIFVIGSSYGAWVSAPGSVPIRAYTGGADAYVACLPGTSAGLIFWNTFLGGGGDDFGRGLALPGAESLFIAGTSGMTWGTPKESFAGGTDAFAVKLSFFGALHWNTFAGGSGYEQAAGTVAVSGVPFLAGTSDEGPWAAGTPVSAYAGDRDGFLAKMNSLGAFSLYTFLGGFGRDEGKAVDVDGLGNVYVAGTSRGSWGDPVRAFNHGAEVFAAKLDAGGALVWNTFLGGTKDDLAAGLAVTAAGVVYVAGNSNATWGSPIRPFGGGGQDAFAAKLDPNGVLQWSTFLGGSSTDYAKALALDGNGNAHVAGYSTGTWGNPVRGYSSSNDAFAAKLSGAGVLLWNTFLGGSGSEIGSGIAVDGANDVYVAGTGTKSWGSPVRGFTSSAGDGFAVKLDSNGALEWNTFLGGSAMDGANAVAAFGTDIVYVAGYSWATWGAPLKPFPGAHDAFAAQLNGNGALQWHTFFGSAAKLEEALSADVDGFGNLYVGGQSEGMWGTPFRAHSGGDDAFAAMFEMSGKLKWNGFFGSAGTNRFGGAAADAAGNVAIVGSSDRSWESPVRPYGGGGDAFAAKIGNPIPAVIAVTSPNGGEIWTGGTVQTITWTTLGIVPSVRIDYSTNGGSTWKAIVASVANTGSYSWMVPDAPSTNCRVRVGAAGGGVPKDTSDAAFTIKAAPKITVTKPNGKEIWICGTVQSIAWTTVGEIANVKIEYSADAGAAWTTINASAPNVGTYAWTVPEIVSTRCLVRISEASTGVPTDRSDAVFKITDTAPTLTLSEREFYFAAERNGTPTPAQTTVLTNTGVGAMTWKAVPSGTWLAVSPGNGTGDAILTISIKRTNLAVGNYTRKITLTAPNATNTPQIITVHLKIKKPGKDAVPFGKFDAPAAAANLTGNVNVTGWALDDVSVGAVKIYRGTSPADRILLGHASFVRGSRPDVEAQFSKVPRNDRAGWAFEWLTNLLPDGGNSAVNLLAYAVDSKGQETLLGTKAVVCDNLHAVKPFGLLETPEIGGMAAGASYANLGWVLTPLPDSIPTDGSTITVYVDGAVVGHPVYNLYRTDVQALFPGLANSLGAGGSFAFDTTGLTNGKHAIVWTARDSGNQTASIGSRDFSICNLDGSYGEAAAEALAEEGDAADSRRPVYMKRGFEEAAPIETVGPDADGVFRIAVPVLSRLALYLDSSSAGESSKQARERGKRLFSAIKKGGERGGRYAAGQIVAGRPGALPPGSSFDARDGVFYWIPGPACRGEFRLVFTDQTGSVPESRTVILAIE